MEGKSKTTKDFKKDSRDEIKQYVALAMTGHYPFLDATWLKDCTQLQEPMTFVTASRNVQQVFERMQNLRTFEHKRLALNHMQDTDRRRFVKSFLKVVEHNMLEKIKSLQ